MGRVSGDALGEVCAYSAVEADAGPWMQTSTKIEHDGVIRNCTGNFPFQAQLIVIQVKHASGSVGQICSSQGYKVRLLNVPTSAIRQKAACFPNCHPTAKLLPFLLLYARA